MLKFNEEKHEYTNNGKKLISVTQLMKKHNLAPNYDNVNLEVLQAKAKRGTLIHKEIEDYIKEGKRGFTDELYEFIDYEKANAMENMKSETMVCNDIVAGTIDLLYMQNDKPHIADHKTTYSLHLDSVSWQESIYLYLYLGDLGDKWEEPKKEEYDEFLADVFHYHNGLNVKDIKLKPFEEVQRLMECERKGIIYTEEIENTLISASENNLIQIATLEQTIKDLDAKVKEAKKQQDALKDALLKEMVDRGLKTFEKDGLKITLVCPKKTITETNIEVEKMDKAIVDEYNSAKEKYDAEAKKYTTTKKTDVEQKKYLKITMKENKDE